MGTTKTDWTTTTIIIDKTARDKLKDTDIIFWWVKMTSNSQKIEALIEMYKRSEIKL
jgi:hypothetical protein